MDEGLFVPTLISGRNVITLASMIRTALRNKEVTLKVTYLDGRVEIVRGLQLAGESDVSGVEVIMAVDRTVPTNSHQIRFDFLSRIFSFETRDDPQLERISSSCFTITNQRDPDGENPIVEVVFSF